jgi:hypothetical protein
MFIAFSLLVCGNMQRVRGTIGFPLSPFLLFSPKMFPFAYVLIRKAAARYGTVHIFNKQCRASVVRCVRVSVLLMCTYDNTCMAVLLKCTYDNTCTSRRQYYLILCSGTRLLLSLERATREQNVLVVSF